MFLVDGLSGNSSKESTTVDAKAVKEDLGQLGFVLSENRCFWEPSLTQTWLGHVFNMSENCLYVTETRLWKLKEFLSSALERTDNVSAKLLAQVTGRIISMSKAFGSAVYLYPRHMYFAIETRQSWDAIIPCFSKVREELQFWDKNVGQLNGKKLFD